MSPLEKLTLPFRDRRLGHFKLAGHVNLGRLALQNTKNHPQLLVRAAIGPASHRTSLDRSSPNIYTCPGKSDPRHTTYAYDGTGELESETVGSTSTQFTWSPNSSVPELLEDGTNDYIYGPSLTPIEQINISSSTPSYLLTDDLGSVRLITDATGDVTGSFTYDAWGNLHGSNGSASSPFGYAGYYEDPTSGLYYLQARWYDAGTGQFLSVDPDVATTGAPYSYADDEPTMFLDPLGLWVVYVLVDGEGIPFYVGRTSQPLGDRLDQHEAGGRYDPESGDRFVELDGNIDNLGEARGVEQLVESSVQTLQSKRKLTLQDENEAKNYNQRNEVGENNPNYQTEMKSGAEWLKENPKAVEQIESLRDAIAANPAPGLDDPMEGYDVPAQLQQDGVLGSNPLVEWGIVKPDPLPGMPAPENEGGPDSGGGGTAADG